MKNYSIFAIQLRRAISSVGSEHLVYTEGVGGSNPSSPTKKSVLYGLFLFKRGSLTQLVQSVTSTTWKSLVRIQYDPHIKRKSAWECRFYYFPKPLSLL